LKEATDRVPTLAGVRLEGVDPRRNAPFEECGEASLQVALLALGREAGGGVLDDTRQDRGCAIA